MKFSTLAENFKGSRIFHSALELGVFQEIGSRKLPASLIAEKIGGDERAVEILLNALVSLRLLSKENGEFFMKT